MKNIDDKTRRNLITAALGGLATVAVSSVKAAGPVKCAELERCYGIAKAHQNDCSTSYSSCQGTAKEDGQPAQLGPATHSSTLRVSNCLGGQSVFRS